MAELARDKVVIEFVAELSKVESAIRHLRDQAREAGKEMSRAGSGGRTPGSAASKDPDNMKQRIGWARWYYNHMRSEGRGWVAEQERNWKRIQAAEKKFQGDSAAYHTAKMRYAKQQQSASEAILNRERTLDASRRRMGRNQMQMEQQLLRLSTTRRRAEHQAIQQERYAADQRYQADMKRIRAFRDPAARARQEAKANRELAQSYREIGSAARTTANEAQRAGGAGLGERIRRTFFAYTSLVRAVRYWGWVVTDFFRMLQRVAQTIINVFVTIIKTWVNVVTSALKLGAAIGVALVGALALAAKQAIDFETAMARVGGLLSKTINQMPQLEKAIRGVAKAFGMSADAAAAAAFELVSYGYGQRQTAAMLPGVTLLARAAAAETGGTPDPRRAAEAIGRILLVWKKDGREAVAVANTMAASNAFTAATFERLYTAMPKAAQAANLVNMSFEETVATLSQLNNAGLDASQAGAALLGLIVRLLAPTEQWKRTVEAHGVAYETVNPKIMGFRGALQNLVRLGLNPMEIATFRNRNGLLALNILVQQGTAEHDRLTQAVTGTHKAEEQSAIMLDTVGAKWQVFKTHVRDLAITLTEKMRPAIKWLLDNVTRWVNFLATSPMVQRLANGLGEAAKGIARLVVNLLNSLKVGRAFPQFIALLVGYMRRFVSIVTIALSVIEWAFRQIADERSPLRKLWSKFWDFIVWSVETAGGGIAFALGATERLFANIFEDMKGNAEKFGIAFIAIMAETAKSVAALPLRMKEAGKLVEAGRKSVEAMQLREETGIKGPITGPMIIGTNKWRIWKLESEAENLTRSAEYWKEQAENVEKGQVGGVTAWFADRIKRAVVESLRNFGAATGAFTGVRKAGEESRADWLRSLQGGGGTPLTDMFRRGADEAINLFLRGVNAPLGGGAGGFGAEAEAALNKFDQSLTDLQEVLEDQVDGTEQNTAALKDSSSAMDGIVSKIIGAPMEVVRRYISAAGFAIKTGVGNLGALMGVGTTNPFMRAAEKQEQAADTQLAAAQMQAQTAASAAGGGGLGQVATGSAGGVSSERPWRWQAARYRTIPGREGHWRTRRIDETIAEGAGGEPTAKQAASARADYERVSRERELIATLGAGGNTPKERQAAQAKIKAEFAADRARMAKHFGSTRRGPYRRTRYEPEWAEGYPERTELISPAGWTRDFSQGAVGGGAASARASLMASPGKWGQRLRESIGRFGGGLPIGLGTPAGWGGAAAAFGMPGGPQAQPQYVGHLTLNWPGGPKQDVWYRMGPQGAEVIKQSMRQEAEMIAQEAWKQFGQVLRR